jgi:hypothetical protein
MTETYAEWLHDRPYYKTLKKWNPGLAPIIVERHPRKPDDPSGFIPRVILGKPGYGKSMYAYKIGAKIFWIFDGCDRIEQEEECYKQSLDALIYRPEQLFEKVKYQRNKSEPALLWIIDDGSVHFGRQLFDQDRKTYRRVQGTIPTVREDTTGLLITTPKSNLLAKPFREFIDEKVEIKLMSEFKENRRVANHYFKNYFPDERNFRIQLPFRDLFSNLCPQPFYSWYLEKKRKALNEYQALCDKLGSLPVDDNEPIEDDSME